MLMVQRNQTFLERSRDRLADASTRMTGLKKQRGCLVIGVLDYVWDVFGVAEVIKTEDYRQRWLSHSLFGRLMALFNLQELARCTACATCRPFPSS